MKLSKIWMVLSIVLIIVLSLVTESSAIQIVAAVCGVIYVFSTALEIRAGQLVGVINAALYGLIMFNTGVYGTAIYNLVYCIPMQIYTFFTWGKNKEGKDRTSISRYTSNQRRIIILFTSLAICIYYIIATKLNVQFAIVDGISIILGIVGLYLTSKKKIEQWSCFLVSNVAMFALWTVKCVESISNLPMLLMWVIYLVNNSYGLYTWNKKLNKLKDKNTENAVV